MTRLRAQVGELAPSIDALASTQPDRPSSGHAWHPLLALQAAAGNQAVQRLVTTSESTAPGAGAWSVSRPRDPDERAADQRAAAAMARLTSGGTRIDRPDSPRSYETLFGHDFSGVRMHHDATAAEFTAQAGARAATVGQQIFFARGAYQPATEQGRDLLLHELAHVTQHDRSDAPRVRRQAATCEELATLPPVSGFTGTRVHKLIQEDFNARVPGAIPNLVIPGASANPLRTEGVGGGDSTVIRPEVIDDSTPGSGDGQPDLARFNGGGLSVAEIKPAAWVSQAEGKAQLDRYVREGNADDVAQQKWRARIGIGQVVPMQPAEYDPPAIAAVGGTVLTAWCNPGLLGYAVRGNGQPVPVAVPATRRDSAREQLAREAQERGVAITVAAGGAAIAGRALWKHFWRAVTIRFAIRGAAAGALSVVDGPLPFGELVSVGLAVATIVQIGTEWSELWRQADQLAADEGA